MTPTTLTAATRKITAPAKSLTAVSGAGHSGKSGLTMYMAKTEPETATVTGAKSVTFIQRTRKAGKGPKISRT